jgi:hypothetical protein
LIGRGFNLRRQILEWSGTRRGGESGQRREDGEGKGAE